MQHPSGPKSTDNYLILYHDGQHEVIKLPRTSDIENQVDNFYNIGSGLFRVESEELNIPAGERLRIPDEIWRDIEGLLGNTNDAWARANEGMIKLERPVVIDGLIVINIGKIDFKLDPISASSTKFTIQIQDEEKNSSLIISIFPHSGLSSLVSATSDTQITWPLQDVFSLNGNHYILIHKQETCFLVQYDSHYVGVVEAPSHYPLTSITYELGARSGFKGPISANVYSGLSHLSDSYGPYNTLFPPTYKETLLHQIVTCPRRNVKRTPKELEAVRREITACQISASGIKWKNQTYTSHQWTQANLEWDFNPQSVYVFRFDVIPDANSYPFYVLFGPQNLYSLRIHMAPDGTVSFAESPTGNNVLETYHTIKLEESIHTAGAHFVALVKIDGWVNVIFDFKQVLALPRVTIIDRKPKDLTVYLGNSSVEVDLYEFAG